jgi:tripartite-type tricarboxylate transporter receptor subunit TctC
MREVLLAFLGLAFLGPFQSVAPAAAQTYPAKAVKIVVGSAPGGSPDVIARLVAQKMSESWGAVLVENRTGANGNLAAEAVSRAAPDGYTAYICDSAIWAINPHLYAKVPYNPLGDFAGVSTLAALPMFLTVHPAVPAQTFAEFVGYAKKNPGKLSYASPGSGSIHHITTELLKSLAGIDLVHVPYKGVAPGAQALAAGEVQVAFISYTALAPLAKADRVRMLAISSGQRTPVLPDIPTVAELAHAGFDMASVAAALVPAGTPRDIVAKLHDGIVAAVASPEVNARMTGFGVTVGTSSPQQADALMRAEHEKYGRLVKLSGAKLD